MRIRTFTFILLAIVLISPAKSNAMTVSDPGSYGYYAEQIKKMQAQFKQLQEQYKVAQQNLEQVNKVRKRAEEMRDNMMGHYNRAKGLYNKAVRLKAEFDSAPTTLRGLKRKWTRIKYYAGDFTDVDGMLDSVWHDPRDDAEEVKKALAELDARYHVRHTAVKEAIESCDREMTQIPEHMDQIGELAQQIDSTENIKDAQDLTNRLLMEILIVMSKHHTLTAQLGQVQSLFQYQGVKDKEPNEEGTESFRVEKKSTSKMDKILIDAGLDPELEDVDDQDILKVLHK
jgi:DNA repair ATPase RecN